MKKILMQNFLMVSALIIITTFLAGCAAGNKAKLPKKATPARQGPDMLSEKLLFNYRLIDSYSSYSFQADADTAEKQVSFGVSLGPSTERQGDLFPVYQVPQDKMVWLSDWSFNIHTYPCPELSVGGSLGRITNGSVYTYVLNCAVFAGEMKIFSPARSIRYLGGDWIAACFHQLGKEMDVCARDLQIY